MEGSGVSSAGARWGLYVCNRRYRRDKELPSRRGFPYRAVRHLRVLFRGADVSRASFGGGGCAAGGRYLGGLARLPQDAWSRRSACRSSLQGRRRCGAPRPSFHTWSGRGLAADCYGRGHGPRVSDCRGARRRGPGWCGAFACRGGLGRATPAARTRARAAASASGRSWGTAAQSELRKCARDRLVSRGDPSGRGAADTLARLKALAGAAPPRVAGTNAQLGKLNTVCWKACSRRSPSKP